MGLRHLKRSPLYIVSVMALGASLPLDAGAWGFGRAQTSAVLGVPLDFNVALRLEPGEAPPECLTVDVTVGDIPLPRSAVSAVLEASSPTPQVRVRTSQAIDEPLVQVNLSAGCSSRVTRRFTLLADPPGHMASPGLASADAVAAAAPTVSSLAQAPAAAAPAASAAVNRTAPAAPALAGSALDAAGRSAATAPSSAASPGVQAGPKDTAASTVSKRPPQAARKSADPGQLADAKAAVPEKPPSPAAARPRLQLDAPTIAAKPAGAGPAAAKSAALLAAEEAASAAGAAASAAEARATAMEKSIDALRQEAKANREALARLTQALQEAQSTSDVPIAMWGALAGLGALSALLMIRLRRQSSGAGQAPWWSAGSSAASQVDDASGDAGAGAAAASSSPLPLPDLVPIAPATTGAPLDKSALAQRQGDAGWAPAAPPAATGLGSFQLNAEPARRELPPLADPEELDPFDGGMDRTQLLPPSASSVSAPIQGVSIEELLDLEQQVEFFTVLGQDDAALSLLVEHLRSTGGTYPLPYLKLMEIYRRRGDEDSYERTRDRFNQRFNAVAPSWGATTPQDRHLEDLPEVMRRIEQVWPRPVDAMALLENMLVRTEGGTLLEMSALGEVLFLFTLARDLHEQEEGSAGPVDVLLPLDDMFGDAPAQPDVAASSPATQFSASSFTKLAAPAAVAVAGLSAASASAPAPLGEDHFDLPLGEPMFEPVFDEPAPSSNAGSTRPEEPAAYQLSMPGSIDLPLTSEAPARGAPAPAEDPFLEPLSFDLPELESIQAPLPSKADSAAPVDLDISLDGLELEPVSPKLSPGEEQAASNFGLFIDSPPTGKPR